MVRGAAAGRDVAMSVMCQVIPVIGMGKKSPMPWLIALKKKKKKKVLLKFLTEPLVIYYRKK